MLAWFVGPKTISRPESFITEVVGDDNSFEMVCFNVISYVSDMALFSTHFANISKLMSIGTSVLTFQHHWIHLVVKFLKVPWIVSRNGHCSIFSKIVDISVGCLPMNSSFWIFFWWECWRKRLFNFFICLPYQTLQLEFFSNSQYERIQTLLENICFPMIKVHNGQEIFRLQPSFYKLVRVLVLSGFRKRAAKITLCASTCWPSSQARVISAKSLSSLKLPMPFWCFPGSCSTEGTAFQTCQCCSLWEFIWTQVRGQNTGQGQK